MNSLAGPIILLLIAAGIYVANENKLFTNRSPTKKDWVKRSPTRKDWVKIRACIAKSQKILDDEAMRTYRLIEWDSTTPEQMDDRRKLLSRLNVEKIDRDSECRERFSF